MNKADIPEPLLTVYDSTFDTIDSLFMAIDYAQKVKRFKGEKKHKVKEMFIYYMYSMRIATESLKEALWKTEIYLSASTDGAQSVGNFPPRANVPRLICDIATWAIGIIHLKMAKNAFPDEVFAKPGEEYILQDWLPAPEDFMPQVEIGSTAFLDFLKNDGIDEHGINELSAKTEQVIARVAIKYPEEIKRTADSKADSKKKSAKKLPRNSKVFRLANAVSKGLKPGESIASKAQEIATEGDITPKSLERLYRRHRDVLGCKKADS